MNDSNYATMICTVVFLAFAICVGVWYFEADADCAARGGVLADSPYGWPVCVEKR